MEIDFVAARIGFGGARVDSGATRIESSGTSDGARVGFVSSKVCAGGTKGWGRRWGARRLGAGPKFGDPLF